ncbi:extracellular matrix protein 14 [Pseudohyphozyma bogoriensis]|nr:extracellular matrix protein 14 [Pseudohyphozyma bogoriensis]
MLLPTALVLLLANSLLAQAQATQQFAFSAPDHSSQTPIPASGDDRHSALTSPSSSHSHRGEQLVRITWPTEDGFEAGLKALEDEDVWRVAKKSRSVDVRIVGDQAAAAVLVGGGAAGATREEDEPLLKTLIPDLGELLDATPSLDGSLNSLHSLAAVRNFTALPTADRRSHSALDDPIHGSYHNYDELVTIMRSFADDFEGFARMVELGKTEEGRTLWGLKISNFTESVEEEDGSGDGLDGQVKEKEKKKGVVIAATQHAREWISASTSLYFAHTLLLATLPKPAPPFPPLKNKSTRKNIIFVLKHLEFTIVPVVNVDGYVYSFEHDRLWRKNRMPLPGGCVGVDLNRNWGYRWEKGARPNPCTDSFPGEKAFQALELQALSSYLLDPANTVSSFVDLHSFGQMIMFPYSYSCKKSSPDAEDQFEAVVGASKALRAVHGRSFETGSVCEISLSGPGDVIDWAYSTAKITWSFTIELRDLGVYGFLLPPSQIQPSGEEASAALLSLANFVVNRKKGPKKFGLRDD